MKKPFKIVGGSCSAADVAKLKADVVAALMSDPVILNIFCVQNNQHCSIGNMKVSCSTVKKRSTGAASNQVHISFDFNVADNAPSGDQSTEMNKMTRIASSLGSLGREVCITRYTKFFILQGSRNFVVIRCYFCIKSRHFLIRFKVLLIQKR